jgi:ribonuclease PH
MMSKQSSSRRSDGRAPDELRSIQFHTGFTAYPEGSVLIKQGNTHVLCNVTVENGIPNWMQAQGVGGGWITAEYAMLPRATHQRSSRETIHPRSRSQEIRRLVGRALRAGIYLNQLPQITCTVDCDVLQADGGTRTAAITGGFVALILALTESLPSDLLLTSVLKSQIAAISVGWQDNQILLDLDYVEDSSVVADLNVVMNDELSLVEVQGTAERGSIPRSIFEEMLDIAQVGIIKLMRLQAEALQSQGINL